MQPLNDNVFNDSEFKNFDDTFNTSNIKEEINYQENQKKIKKLNEEMKEINDIIYGEGEDKLKEKLKMYKENPEKVLKFFETKYTYSTYNDTYYKLNNPNNIVYKKYGEVEIWSMNNNYGKKNF